MPKTEAKDKKPGRSTYLTTQQTETYRQQMAVHYFK